MSEHCPQPSAVRSGGRLVVDALLVHGVPRVFGVPGESYLPVLDALYDVSGRLPFIACRHEHAASMMAEAHGKLTGEPGVCLVTRGPGACNAAIGVHTAFQDSTPMLLLVGQVDRPFRGREAFQEVDLVQMFRPLAKHVAEVADAAGVPDALASAFRIARQGRPGPVVLALPEDVLQETAEAPGSAPLQVQPLPVQAAAPDPGELAALAALLQRARRPMLLLGGSGWDAQARTDIAVFARSHALPVCCGFRRNDCFDNNDPCYAGELGIGANPALVARVGQADLLIALGSRLGEATTQGYTLIATDGAAAPAVVHVHPDATELGRVFAPALGIAAAVAPCASALRALPAPPPDAERRAWLAAARAEFLADTEPAPREALLDPGQAMRVLRDALPEDAIVCVDAGNFSGWPQRYLRFGGGRRLLGACNGAMGYGVPAAIAAKLECPERLVVACAGDGGFGMTGSDLSTAVAQRLGILVLVFDNGMYGTIRMHQERDYPARTVGTQLSNPDFAALAAAHGAHGERIARTAEVAPALQRAIAATGQGRPALLVLALDPEIISTRTTIGRLRASAGASAGRDAADG